MSRADYKQGLPTRKSIDYAVERVIGQQMRVARLAAGLSQVALGAMIGVSFQQIQKYEKGANRLSASGLRRLAQVLNLPVAFFIGEDVLTKPQIVDGKMIDLAGKIQQLAPRDIAIIKRMMRSMGGLD